MPVLRYRSGRSGSLLAGSVATLFLSMLVFPCWLAAQEQIGLDTTEAVDIDAAMGATGKPSPWDIRLGVLAAISSKYDGSDAYEVSAVPYARISWNDRIIYRGRSLEANIYRSESLRIGPMVRSRGGRDENDDGVLNGLGDVDRAYEVGAFARLKRGPVRLRFNAVHDVAGAHDGLVLDFSAGLQLPMKNPWLSLRVATTWVDDNYMTSYFGINTVQAARSALGPFTARSGIKDVRVTAGSRIALNAHVSALLSVGYTRLIGDAGDSPIVAKHGDADQNFAAIGAVYSF
jgi:outer membrane protein